MLGADMREPVLPAHGVDVVRRDASRGEPVGAFPAELGAEDGAGSLQPIIERRDNAVATGLIFLMREGDCVMLAVGFEGAFLDPVAVAMEVREAADVDDPEIERSFAAHGPFGEGPAGAAARGDAEGVEAGADIHVGAFGRGTEDEIAVGREAFGAVDHLADAGGLEGRNARHGLFEVLGEMVPVVVEELELEGARDIAGGPGDRVGLIAAHDEAADLLLEIGAAVGIAQGRDVGGEAVDLFGDDVLVLDRLQRHVDAGHDADLAGPLATAVDHRFSFDTAIGGQHRLDAAAVHFEAGDADALVDPGAMHAGAAGERLGDVGRRGLAIGGEP